MLFKYPYIALPTVTTFLIVHRGHGWHAHAPTFNVWHTSGTLE